MLPLPNWPNALTSVLLESAIEWIGVKESPAKIISAHPETVISPDVFVMLKILSSEYQPYAGSKIFRMP